MGSPWSEAENIGFRTLERTFMSIAEVGVPRWCCIKDIDFPKRSNNEHNDSYKPVMPLHTNNSHSGMYFHQLKMLKRPRIQTFHECP